MPMPMHPKTQWGWRCMWLIQRRPTPAVISFHVQTCVCFFHHVIGAISPMHRYVNLPVLLLLVVCCCCCCCHRRFTDRRGQQRQQRPYVSCVASTRSLLYPVVLAILLDITLKSTSTGTCDASCQPPYSCHRPPHCPSTSLPHGHQSPCGKLPDLSIRDQPSSWHHFLWSSQ